MSRLYNLDDGIGTDMALSVLPAAQSPLGGHLTRGGHPRSLRTDGAYLETLVLTYPFAQ